MLEEYLQVRDDVPGRNQALLQPTDSQQNGDTPHSQYDDTAHQEQPDALPSSLGNTESIITQVRIDLSDLWIIFHHLFFI